MLFFVRGKEKTVKGKKEIVLNNWQYYDHFNIQITPIGSPAVFFVSEFKEGKFKVHGEGTFYWLVTCEIKKDLCVHFNAIAHEENIK